MRERLQSWGGFLAAMVIPNLGAFIAWGIITAFFIPTGWVPSERFSALVGPMILNLLPILIGFTGGKMIYGHRGGVIGALVTVGVIVGSDIPQFLGGMIVGPTSAWILMKIDNAVEDRTPIGFELLVNNLVLGILGTILAMISLVAVSPFVTSVSNIAGGAVEAMVNAGVLPLVDLVIEPAKVLFLNNALNHGVLAPLGAAAAEQTGRAIHFLLETNPGPGLGLLLAYYVAGKGLLKESAPGAAIIHFLGGIHEIYFPYVLAHPIMILAMYAGGILADIWFVIFDAGLVATPSPGSILAYLVVIPPGQHFPVLGGVTLAIVASFIAGVAILRAFPVKEEDQEEAEETSMEAVPGLS